MDHYLSQQLFLTSESIGLLPQCLAILLCLGLHGDEGALCVSLLHTQEADGGIVSHAEIVHKVVLRCVLLTLDAPLRADGLLVQ